MATSLRLTEEEMHSELASLMYVNEVVDGEGLFLYIDRVVSMSALAEAEATCVSDDQIKGNNDHHLDGLPF